MIIDTHCHLNSPKFSEDRDAIIRSAYDAGVSYIIIPGYDHESSKEALKIANEHAHCRALIGIHPEDCDQWSEEIRKEFHAFLSGNKHIVGIGEIGLDYHWDTHPRPLQKHVFRQQTALATEFDLPISIHSRDAEEDCYLMVKELTPPKAVFHCYSGSVQLARDIWELGYHTSFTGNITYPKAEELREVVFECPLDKIMIETDAPYLAPQMYRGQRCEPAHIIDILEMVAQIKKMDIDIVRDQLYKNSCEFFKIA